MKIKHIAIIVSFLLSVSAFAQHNEEITIEGAYRPKVNKVDKIVLKPDMPEQVFDMPDTKVKVLDIERRSRLNLDKFSPLAYYSKKNSGDNAAKNFLLAGFGSRISPVFLFNHNSRLTKSLGLSVGLKHFSSWLDIQDYAPSGFMNNAVEVGLTDRNFYGMQLRGKVYYKNDAYHYYGLKTAEWTLNPVTLTHSAPQQMYNTIGTRIGFSSTNNNLGVLKHNADFNYHCLFWNVGRGVEHFARMNYDLAYVDSWWGKKNYPQRVGVVVDVQYGFNDIYAQNDVSRGLVKLTPYFEMSDDFYRLHLGVGLDAASKFDGTAELFGIYPDVKGSLFVLNKVLEFYAGLDGGCKWRTYSDLIEENPFVFMPSKLEISQVKLGFEGGVRTNILNTVDAHVGVRYRNIENDCFFRQQIIPATDGMTMDRPYNSFELVYDETSTVSVLGNVRWLAMDGLTVDAGFTYNHCDPVKEEHAWYRPETEGTLNVNYQLNDDLSFDASFLYQGGRWAQYVQEVSAKSVKMRDVYDLGLGANYRIKDQFSVFVKADNLLAQKYQLFYDYPVTGIEVFAGLKLAF